MSGEDKIRNTIDMVLCQGLIAEDVIVILKDVIKELEG